MNLPQSLRIQPPNDAEGRPTALPPTEAPPPVASLWARLTAYVLDAAFWAVAMVAWLQLLLLAHTRGLPGPWFWPVVIVSDIALWCLVFAVLQSGKRCSPGQWCAGIRFRKLHGEPLSFGQSLWRQFAFRLLNCIGLLGLLSSIPALWHKRTPVDFCSRSFPAGGHSGSRATMVLAWLLAPASLAAALFVLPVRMVEGPSMEPAAAHGQRVLVNRYAAAGQGIAFQQVVVTRPPQALENELGREGQERVHVRRCLGRPGDRVEIRANQLFLNGSPVAEPYARYEFKPLPGALNLTAFDLKVVGGKVFVRNHERGGRKFPWYQAQQGRPWPNQGQIEKAGTEPVPPGQFLLLGDNRFVASDSRVWGLMPASRILGTGIVVPGWALASGNS